MLPDESTLEAVQRQGETCLNEADLSQYEVSAFSRRGEESRHNLNYWEFGDYLGVGAGAHGKLSLQDGAIVRSPTNAGAIGLSEGKPTCPPCRRHSMWPLAPEEKTVEFAMNALRLKSGVPIQRFAEHTGLPVEQLAAAASTALSRGWIEDPRNGQFRTTPLGYRFLDSVIATFL